MQPALFEPQYIPLPNGITVSDTKAHKACCPTCEKPLLLRPRTMAVHLVQSLNEIIRINGEERRPAVVDDIQRFAATLVDKRVNGRTMNATYTELKYWGLIEPVNVPVFRNGKIKDVQGWEVTNEGAEFVAGRLTIPERVWVFNDKPRQNPGKESRFISVSQVRHMEETDDRIAAMSSEGLECDADIL